MLEFIKKCFFTAINVFSYNVLNVNSFQCVSMNNQKCKIKLEIIIINTTESVFYPFSIKVNECSGSCNNINDPYAKLCVLDVVKNLNVKVLNLVLFSNQTRHIKWHKTCECKCRLDASCW